MENSEFNMAEMVMESAKQRCRMPSRTQRIHQRSGLTNLVGLMNMRVKMR
jgi:hypothetical protein